MNYYAKAPLSCLYADHMCSCDLMHNKTTLCAICTGASLMTPKPCKNGAHMRGDESEQHKPTRPVAIETLSHTSSTLLMEMAEGGGNNLTPQATTRGTLLHDGAPNNQSLHYQSYAVLPKLYDKAKAAQNGSGACDTNGSEIARRNSSAESRATRS